MKNLQFWPKSLGPMPEYWYIESGLLRLSRYGWSWLLLLDLNSLLIWQYVQNTNLISKTWPVTIWKSKINSFSWVLTGWQSQSAHIQTIWTARFRVLWASRKKTGIWDKANTLNILLSILTGISLSKSVPDSPFLALNVNSKHLVWLVCWISALQKRPTLFIRAAVKLLQRSSELQPSYDRCYKMV